MKLNDETPNEMRGVTMKVTDPETGHFYFLEWKSSGRFVKDCASLMNRSIIVAWWLRMEPGEIANGTKSYLSIRAAKYIEDAFDFAVKKGIKPE